MISKKRFIDAEDFYMRLIKSENKVVANEAVIKHLMYLFEHIRTLEKTKI